MTFLMNKIDMLRSLNINGNNFVVKNSTYALNDDVWICLTKNEAKKPIVELIVLFLFKIYKSNCLKTVVTGFEVSAHSKNKSSDI